MKNDIQTYVNGCLACLKRQRGKPNRYGLLQNIKTTKPFEIVSIDIVGPYKKTRRNNLYVLCCIDLFTGWVEAIPLKSLEAAEVVNAVHKLIITRHGCPNKILTDQGTQFTSDQFKNFCRKYKIEKLTASSQHPQTNGKVERFNRYLNNALE